LLEAHKRLHQEKHYGPSVFAPTRPGNADQLEQRRYGIGTAP
jgi:hypothetical protein